MALSLMHQWHDTICDGVISPRCSLLYGAYGCILGTLFRSAQVLTVIVRDLIVIDMGELARPQICEELDDTWAWVDKGDQAIPAPAQHEVMDAMYIDLSRFTMWAVGGISQILDSAGATYNKTGRPRCKEIDNVGEVSTIWKSRSVGVLKSQDGRSKQSCS
ncbi:hypothetical protein Tco_0209405 [Tanacetum coccineum]